MGLRRYRFRGLHMCLVTVGASVSTLQGLIGFML